MRLISCVLAGSMICGMALAQARAEDVLHDSTLPSVPPRALQELSDDRLRERIMLDSVAPYHGSCACSYQTRPNGGTCRGHIHPLRGHKPLCYPRDVTDAMLLDWRREHR
jgi:hypothetical protein